MKKYVVICVCVITSFVSFCQTSVQEKYATADSLLTAEKYSEAHEILKSLEPVCDKTDTLYLYVLWNYVRTTTYIEYDYRMDEQFDSSLVYGLQALELINKGKQYFDDEFADREYWMIKNIIVSNFGLGKLKDARTYQNMLYKAYKKGELPEGINEYYNFSYFKFEDKNVWGYEWFEELPKDRNSKSFSKIVYYVYSTNSDGTDNEQLYRLHVLMFHKFNNSVKFDYVLTKQLETATNETSGTLYAYIYNEDIDLEKLQADVLEVLKGNYKIDAASGAKK